MSDRFNENTTHVLFPRGVDYQAGLQSLKSTPTETVRLVSIDWLPDCIAERKLILTTQFEVRTFFGIAVCNCWRLGGILEFSRYGREEGKPARCPFPSNSLFEAWKLASGARVFGRIKMAETSTCLYRYINF